MAPTVMGEAVESVDRALALSDAPDVDPAR